MMEEFLYEYLKNKVGDTVFMTFPKKRLPMFTVMQRIDGGRVNHISASTFSFVSYAGSLYEAACQNEKVSRAIYDSITDPRISHADLGGENSREDTENHLWCYESIFNFIHY